MSDKPNSFIKKTEIILHPVRMRILQNLATRHLTPLQLAEELVNVPQATLYRHLNKLVEAGILLVVEERPVRGTVEKVYGLNLEAMKADSQALLNGSREELLELFTHFILARIHDFGVYLQREQVNLVEDRVTFGQAPFYLSDAEFREFAGEIGQAFMKRLNNKPAPDRKHFIWTTIIMPGPDESPAAPGEATGGTEPESDAG
jgi:DNA-binding transcriptional ArsR family regulator